ncbi:hypothetical protein JJ775_000993 [Clostridium perfringens]|uniref:hypothetical protein n=1 Tax=Clostridium perfringens TaxID=1502 RepID=UPI002902FD96|nr:hypothetical protein [Clostridium perfringens]EHA1184360.1 hypothetical protein [Clostridium perfringens]EHK2367094.1 hypothetical protein [Clostridium perfringens]MDU2325158.1 hypothetical protein [Clostridium perfringens]
MLTLIYLLTMAIAFTNIINGELVPFYYRYIISFIWIIIWIILRKGKLNKRSLYSIEIYCLPLLLILIWSFIIWIIDKPADFSFAYVNRMLSNIFYLFLTYFCAIIGVDFFGRKAIKLSALAMFLSTIINVVIVIKIYGLGMFISYIGSAFLTTDYEFGSTMYNLSVALEVQDITIASGFYIIYFLLYDKYDNKKTRAFYCLLMCLCCYIGFKRTVLIGISIALFVHYLVSIKLISFKRTVNIIGIFFVIIATIYICVIKYDLIGVLANTYDVNTMGRTTIYNWLSSYYEISPFFIGNGFCYVDKLMYESTGFATHTIFGRMFAEIGFIPFYLWLIYYLVAIPKKIFKKFGKESSFIALTMTVYLFSTYFTENTLSLYCIQYSFLLIPLASISHYVKEKK